MNLSNRIRLNEYMKVFSGRTIYTLEEIKKEIENLGFHEFMMSIPIGGNRK